MIRERAVVDGGQGDPAVLELRLGGGSGLMLFECLTNMEQPWTY